MPKYTTKSAKGSGPASEKIDIGGRTFLLKAAGRGKQMPPVKAGKAGSLQAPALSIPLETKPSSEAAETPLHRLLKNRLDCKETAETLFQIADWDEKSPLYTGAGKIKNCSLAGAFRSLEPGVNHKIGQALCRHRLCPNCQRVLSLKRRASFDEWFHLNEQPLAGYEFFHMVLNVRHSAASGLRAGLYTSELLDGFAALRGSGKSCNRAERAWWNKRVSGGIYSVELSPGKTDSSAHIHIHVILFCAPGTIPIYRKDKNSQFVQHLTKRWRSITNDPLGKAIFLKPVYNKTEAGEEATYQKGDAPALLHKAVAECMKYTLKTDESNLTSYSAAFLAELVTTPNRYFGRFGVLSKKMPGSEVFKELERLNTNFKDLESMQARELETLYNPETGKSYQLSETRIALSYFTNTKSIEAPKAAPLAIKRGEKQRGCETYYKFRNLAKVGFLHPDQAAQAALYLARTIRADYDPENDLASPPESRGVVA